MTSGFRWSDTLFHCYDYESLIAIVPSSILSIKDGDDRIEITADRGILCGIHLLYKTEITMIRCPSLGDLESEMNSLSLGGNTNNVEDERSNHLHSDLESKMSPRYLLEAMLTM
ncbi:hypothetical protein POM88_019885 [Heracleum sosnowskyi]|uniref:Uncharacterized protein n=1 Tax=Heracleum sosnowskyi TaxID=360622 RepID=A0AAD8IDY6_9APIA|nr:hypothetical protein POM88_019885 [Heracleum sosnowskyi]